MCFYVLSKVNALNHLEYLGSSAFSSSPRSLSTAIADRIHWDSHTTGGMSSTKWTKFFQDYTQHFAGVGALGLYLSHLYPHNWGLRKYRSVFNLYQEGNPVPVDENSRRLAEECFVKLQWDPTEEASVDFFTVYGYDVSHKGSTYLAHGALVGIPIFFGYQKSSDVERSRFTFHNKPINWDAPAGKQLLDSLVYSDDAKQFAIARELHAVHSHYPHIEGFIASFFAFLTYSVGYVSNRTIRFPRRLPMALRGIVYSAIGSLGLTAYLLGMDNYHCWRESRQDRAAANMGPEFICGGIEFYEQQLKRNLALRELSGTRGDKVSTVYGNEPHVWRQPHLPITARRDALAAMLPSRKKGKVLSTGQPDGTEKSFLSGGYRI